MSKKTKDDRPPELIGGDRINVYMDAKTRKIAEKIGNGNLSEGIRIALLKHKTSDELSEINHTCCR